MRRSRIYCQQALVVGEHLTLDQRNSHYLLHVLRIKQGDELALFDGLGEQYHAVVTEVGRKQVVVAVDKIITGVNETESPLHITLAIAISKGERMDWVMQKATELGVSVIQPLITKRVDVKLNKERMQKKYQHWQGVVIGACEQSGRNILPKLMLPVSIDDWLDTVAADVKLVLRADGKSFSEITNNYSPAPKSAVVLIGPEGGLCEAEIASAEQAGFLSTGFGKRVLRTETAPIVALSLLQLAWGDF